MPHITLEPDLCCDYIEYEIDEYAPMLVSDLPAYTGATTFTPSSESQTVATNGTAMHDDITVNAIPYTEQANQYGTTVEIGGE